MPELIEINLRDIRAIRFLCKLIKTIWNECYNKIFDQKIVEYICYFIKPSVIKNEIKEGAKYYFIVKNEVKIGFVCFYVKEDFLYLARIYLEENERRKQSGLKIFEQIKEIASQNNLNKIRIYVDKKATSAIKAFLGWGFVEDEEVVRYIGDEYFLMNLSMTYFL